MFEDSVGDDADAGCIPASAGFIGGRGEPGGVIGSWGEDTGLVKDRRGFAGEVAVVAVDADGSPVEVFREGGVEGGEDVG